MSATDALIVHLRIDHHTPAQTQQMLLLWLESLQHPLALGLSAHGAQHQVFVNDYAISLTLDLRQELGDFDPSATYRISVWDRLTRQRQSPNCCLRVCIRYNVDGVG